MVGSAAVEKWHFEEAVNYRPFDGRYSPEEINETEKSSEGDHISKSIQNAGRAGLGVGKEAEPNAQ